VPHNVVHFAIEADDLRRARRFYENVFGWKFTPWGPPDFFQIRTGTDDDPGVAGALQRRNDPLTGTGNRTFQCTIAVDSIERIMHRITAHGGTVVTEPCLIVGVGTLIYFNDPEGNRAGAMQYDPTAGRDT
jgi:uncharacterized protein